MSTICRLHLSMTQRSSCNKRSDHSSRSGTRRNKPSGRGPAPRNQNTSSTEDSSRATNRRGRTRSNSGSESTHSTPSESTHSHSTSAESRTRDHNRRPTDALGSAGGQHGNSNNMELGRPEDPENHKRKLNEAIIEVLSSASPSKKLKSLYFFFFWF